MSKKLILHLKVKKFWTIWSVIHRGASIINIAYCAMIISSLMFGWYEFPTVILYTPLYTPIFVRYLKTLIYLFPWKYSYWNYKANIQTAILEFKINDEFDNEIFSDFILGKKVARGAVIPLMRKNFFGFLGMSSNVMSITWSYVAFYRYLFQTRLRRYASVNQGANFTGKSKLLWFFVVFAIYDPFHGGVEETYRFTKLISYIDFLDDDKSIFVKNMYSTAKVKRVKPMFLENAAKYKPVDVISFVLVSTTWWKPEVYPGLRESFNEYKLHIRS